MAVFPKSWCQAEVAAQVSEPRSPDPWSRDNNYCLAELLWGFKGRIMWEHSGNYKETQHKENIPVLFRRVLRSPKEDNCRINMLSQCWFTSNWSQRPWTCCQSVPHFLPSSSPYRKGFNEHKTVNLQRWELRLSCWTLDVQCLAPTRHLLKQTEWVSKKMNPCNRRNNTEVKGPRDFCHSRSCRLVTPWEQACAWLWRGTEQEPLAKISVAKPKQARVEETL